MRAETRRSQQQADVYEEERRWCKQFIERFEADQYHHPRYGRKKYLCEIQETLDTKKGVLEIHLEDLEEFFTGEKYRDFLANIRANTLRYINFFSQAANDTEVECSRRLSPREELEQDLLNYQIQNFDRTSNIDVLSGNGVQVPPAKRAENLLKNQLKNRFDVIIIPGPNSKHTVQRLRDLKADVIGSLVSVKGTVVRISDVRSLIQLVTSTCTVCGEDVFKTVSGKEFMPPVICHSEKCRSSNSRGVLVPNFCLSRFIPYQELKIQETTDQTPIGTIPRLYTVYLRGHSVRKCTPGDVVIIDGVFLPRLQEHKNFRDALLHETYIEGMKVERVKKGPSHHATPSNTELFEFQNIAKQPNVFERLANSIAPEIFGMESVKKALLFQMLGGCNVAMPDGIRIRGDLNVAIIGDPGVAKSQLLKHVAFLSPRGIYTTGKGSSGAGLTASVVRDGKSGEISLEGGALVLADLGICCIDEFDKMEDNDKVAIHEVMEQQTISIAKAGITTSLNARTSILAAANPVYGRYDRAKSPHDNIGLSYSLLSRFDLIYILLDKSNAEKDMRLAEHITHLHQTSTVQRPQEDIIPMHLFRNYLAYAKTFAPNIPPDLHGFIVRKYIEKRRKNQEKGRFGQYITARTLLSLIRFTLAAAKARLSEEVQQSDIEEVLTLMAEAHDSVLTEDEERDRAMVRRNQQSTSQQIYNLIRKGLRDNNGQPLALSAIERMVTVRGFTRDALHKTIAEYEGLNMFQKVNEGTMLAAIN